MHDTLDAGEFSEETRKDVSGNLRHTRSCRRTGDGVTKLKNSACHPPALSNFGIFVLNKIARIRAWISTVLWLQMTRI